MHKLKNDLGYNARKSNIINFNFIKKQHFEHQRLEIIMHDALDNIEAFGFQFYLHCNCDIDSIDNFEVLADDEVTANCFNFLAKPSDTSNLSQLKAQA